MSEYADHYGAPMEALQIGTIPDVKEEGKGLNMEVDQYKVPGTVLGSGVLESALLCI